MLAWAHNGVGLLDCRAFMCKSNIEVSYRAQSSRITETLQSIKVAVKSLADRLHIA